MSQQQTQAPQGSVQGMGQAGAYQQQMPGHSPYQHPGQYQPQGAQGGAFPGQQRILQPRMPQQAQQQQMQDQMQPRGHPGFKRSPRTAPMQAYGQMNTGGQIYGLNPNVSPSNQALRPTTAPFGETAGPSYDNHGLGRQPAPFVATDYSQRPKTSAEDFFAGISSSQQQASQQQSHPSEHPVPLQSQSQQPIRQTPVAPDQSRFGAEQHLNDARGTPADQRVGHRPGLSMEAPNPGKVLRESCFGSGMSDWCSV